MTYITKKRKLRSNMEKEARLQTDAKAAHASAQTGASPKRSARIRSRSEASASASASAEGPASVRVANASLKAAHEDDDANAMPPPNAAADQDATPPEPSTKRPRTRTRSRGLSLASAATDGNESAGPTIAGPMIEVIDPETLDRVMGGADHHDYDNDNHSLYRDRLHSFAAASAVGVGSTGLTHDLDHGTDTHSHLHDPQGHDPVDTLIGTAVDALLGSARPRSMSQESIGSLGFRSRSNTLDLMAGAGLLGGTSSDLLGGGRRSRSNTLEFLSGVALGEGGAGIGHMSTLPSGVGESESRTPPAGVGAGPDSSIKTKPRSGSQGSHSQSSHHSGISALSSTRKMSVPEPHPISSMVHHHNHLLSHEAKPDDITSALDHLDALGETKPSAVAAAAAAAASGMPKTAAQAAENKNRKNSEHSHDSAHTMDTTNQKLLYEALVSGGGASGVGSGGRERADTTESWAALIATTARDRADSWGGMSDISFGAAAGHADIVAEITANALHPSTGLTEGSAHTNVSQEDAAGSLALVQMSTPPTSSHASLASGSSAGAGAGRKARGQKTGDAVTASAKASVPKKIAIKSKDSASKRSAGNKNMGKGSASKVGSSSARKAAVPAAPKTQSLCVHFPKNMPHGAAAAAAKAAAEAACAAGASPAELSAIVAAAMATVSKQLFNIAGDVEKALLIPKKGSKTPPGMKKVKIEYSARKAIMKAKPKKATKGTKRPTKEVVSGTKGPTTTVAKASPAVVSNAAIPRAVQTAQTPAAKKSSVLTEDTPVVSNVSKASKVGKPVAPNAALNVKKGPQVTAVPLGPVGSKTSRQLENKRLPPRKRTDSGFAHDFDIPVMDLPAPLPDEGTVKDTRALPVASKPTPSPATTTPVLQGKAVPPSLVLSSDTPQISVDYDAVAAAVDAANSATLPLPDAITSIKKPNASANVPDSTTTAIADNSSSVPGSNQAKLAPEKVVNQSHTTTSAGVASPSPKTIPSTNVKSVLLTPEPQPPLKKRTKRPSPEKPPMDEKLTVLPPLKKVPFSTPTDGTTTSDVGGTKMNSGNTANAPCEPRPPGPQLSHQFQKQSATPKVVNRPNAPLSSTPSTAVSSLISIAQSTPENVASSYSASNSQSNQKWDEMFDCLVEYVREQHAKHAHIIRGGRKWKWDGNVPTTYKTSDGKALGRWINNQRSAKTKGTLKPEREERLLSTGLKWSVLSTNAWPDMLKELTRYVEGKRARGETWDGNVPTNYTIKASDTDTFDEDKNLGRWINRQRSLYQAGKLKKERQEELERIGLRWSVLSTTSWDVMFEALLEYAEERRNETSSSEWDGNVPANYKTDDNPPKSLGRWVNRQRSAYAKNKLKQEFVDRLEEAGLKWSVHEKRDADRSDDAIEKG